MRHRRRSTLAGLLAGLAGLLLALGAAALGTLALASPSRADRAAPIQAPPRREPVPVQRDLPQAAGDYVAHEWGVWRLEAGQVTHLADLRRESPPFVRQLPQAQQGSVGTPPVRPPPHWGGGAVARKPVIFFYADRPLPVRVEVSFTGGEPWLAYPAPTGHAPAAQRGGSGVVVFDGHLQPAFDARSLPPVRRGHFWTDLRAVGATPFLTGGPALGATASTPATAERFVFYDGPVRFPRVVEVLAGGTFRVAHPQITPGFGLWRVESGRVQELRIGPNGLAAPAGGGFPIADLDAHLLPALTGSGLTGAEARSLLRVWRDDLRAPRAHAIYLLPRAIYDQLLPITLSPPPRELVRTGLVIERL